MTEIINNKNKKEIKFAVDEAISEVKLLIILIQEDIINYSIEFFPNKELEVKLINMIDRLEDQLIYIKQNHINKSQLNSYRYLDKEIDRILKEFDDSIPRFYKPSILKNIGDQCK